MLVPQTNNSTDTAYPDLKPGKPTIQQFLGKVYSNPKYQSLSPENKQKFDSQTYDRFVVPYYQKIAKVSPPEKDEWLKVSPEERTKIPDAMRFGKFVPFAAKQVGNVAQESYYRAARGGEKIGKNVVDLAFKVFEPGDAAEKNIYNQWTGHVDKFLGDLIGDADKHIRQAREREPELLKSDPIKKTADFAMNHVADLALFKAIGSVSGGLTEGLTPTLGKTPVGKFVLESVVGAADGYVSGYGVTGKPEEAKAWAEFGGVLGGGGVIAGDVIKGDWRARKYFGTVLGLMGADWLSESLKSTAAKMEAGEFLKGVAQKTTDPYDPLVRKLNTANQVLYNDYARRMYPHRSGYTALSKFEKDDVLTEVFKDVKAASDNIPAYSAAANLYNIENTNSRVMKNPVVRQSVQQLRKATQQVTGSPDFQAAADYEQRQAAKNVVATVVRTKSAVDKLTREELSDDHIDTLRRIKNIKRQKLTASADQVPILNARLEELQSEKKNYEQRMDAADRIVPGAAGKYTPEFTQDAFLRYRSLGKPIEDPNDQATFDYWLATNGHHDSKLAQKIKDTYEAEHPDPNERAALEQGLTEHMTKLFQTGHIKPGEAGVYRSGEYGTGRPITKWQKQLNTEYEKTTESQKIKSAVQPSRTFNIGRGAGYGQVRVSFPSDDLANLYAYAGRVKKQMSGTVGHNPMRQVLTEKFGKDLFQKSQNYRALINKLIKNLEEDSIFMAPEPE